MLTLTPAFVLGAILVVANRLSTKWNFGPMVAGAMFAFLLSATSPARPALDALNNAFVSLLNSVGGGAGLV